MRWIWIDRIIELERGRACVAVKNISLAEEVFNDAWAATPDGPNDAPPPIFPNTLIIEGMAQTAGILVGHYNDFQKLVVLAKIGRAKFHLPARPGDTLRYSAELQQINPTGASTTGQVERIDPATSLAEPLADINLMFSHMDSDRAGIELPDDNFVFKGQLIDLLRHSGVDFGKNPAR